MARIYRFDDVEIDLRSFRALKVGKTLPIESKALNVLVFPLENPSRLVKKQELLDAVWTDAFVSDWMLDLK